MINQELSLQLFNNGSHLIFVFSKFVLQTLNPIYEKLANVFAGDKNVLIGKVDATEHEELGRRLERNKQYYFNVKFCIHFIVSISINLMNYESNAHEIHYYQKLRLRIFLHYRSLIST